jgi:hypothetical protein
VRPQRPDIRRIATRLGLTWDDLRATADSQTAKAQQERLNVACFTDLAITADLVGEKEAGRSVVAWLAEDELVAPFAAASSGSGAEPTAHVVAAEGWQDFYAAPAKGRVDPATGETLTEEAAQARGHIARVHDPEPRGLPQGRREQPGRALLHEAIHALAPDAFDDQDGRRVDEGTTEYFARRVAAKAGKHPPNAYKAEYAGVQALAAVSATRSWPRPSSRARPCGSSPRSSTPAAVFPSARDAARPPGSGAARMSPGRPGRPR